MCLHYTLLVTETSYKKTFDMRLDSLDEKTKRNYGIALRNFERYFGDNAIKQLKNPKNRYNLLQGWVNSNLKTMTPNATKSYFSRIKQYLNHCGIEISSEQVKANLRFPKNHQERFYATSIEDIQKILDNSDYKHKTMYLCQLSGGLRIGELVQLRKENLTPKDGRFIVEIPSKIAKNHKGRITFFSFEASKYLSSFMKRVEGEQLFGTNENSFHSEINEEQIFRRALNRAGLTKKYSITGRFKINTHSLRAYFITKASRHDPHLAHFLSGQPGKIYLAQYDRLTDEEMYEIYLKIEPDLIIEQSNKDKLIIEKQKKELSKIEELEDKQKNNKETLKTLSQLYMLEATEPVIHTKEAYEEEDQFREELRNKLKKLVNTDELVLDF